MQAPITREFVRALALAQGVTIPDERLDDVLAQYRAFMESIARLDSLALPKEAEPEIIFAPSTHTAGPR